MEVLEIMLTSLKELFIFVNAWLTGFDELVEVKTGDVRDDGKSSVVQANLYQKFEGSLYGLWITVCLTDLSNRLSMSEDFFFMSSTVSCSYLWTVVEIMHRLCFRNSFLKKNYMTEWKSSCSSRTIFNFDVRFSTNLLTLCPDSMG